MYRMFYVLSVTKIPSHQFAKAICSLPSLSQCFYCKAAFNVLAGEACKNNCPCYSKVLHSLRICRRKKIPKGNGENFVV
jgi:hypothetical protein